MDEKYRNQQFKKLQYRMALVTGIIVAVFILALWFLLLFSSTAQAGLMKDLDGRIYIPEGSPEIQPIYHVFRYGEPIDACPKMQWTVWRLATAHGYCHRLVFGLIIRESTFRANSHNTYGDWRGLAQIHPSWTRNRLIAPHRLTDDHADRCLFDPKSNILTLIEIWNYARYTYDIDTSTEQGMREILWWHMSGNHVEGIEHWEIERVFRFADELVPYQQPI